MSSDPPIITKSKLISDLKSLGLTTSETVMIHVSAKATGWIVGGPDVIIHAILDVLGPSGTLMMYIKSEDPTDDFEYWPEDRRQAYLDECPPFDPQRSRAYRKWSILTEYVRTWPGAHCSNHPEARIAAIGAKAQWITETHPLKYGYGQNSPLAKLCEARGKVLLLGAPLTTLTILHHAEHIAEVPNKRIERFKYPMLISGEKQWIEIEQFDTSEGIVDWQDGDYFLKIVEDYLKQERHKTGKAGAADSYLFDAKNLTDFAVSWMEKNFRELP
ncbi:MAG: aminoglycoside 3-N-acetyltransferase [Candidatus Latescibacteria bacterium]|nr:aminoglycoside 3-N-acetyltransferase [Candidatus Latescibacterota bacterium]